MLESLLAMVLLSGDAEAGIRNCRPIESDVARLECYDAIADEQTVTPSSGSPHEPLWAVVDAHFRQTLFDRESARDYGVTTPFPCVEVRRQLKSIGTCLCATLNAKNRMGGYTGRRAIAFAYPPGAEVTALKPWPDVTGKLEGLCEQKGFVDRPASLLHR